MAKQNRIEKGLIDRNMRVAKRYGDRIRSQFTAQQDKWQERVDSGLQKIDSVFSRSFAFPQLTPQLQLVTATGAQLSPEDMQQVAYYMATNSNDSSANKATGGSRRERRAQEKRMRKELSPAAWRFLTALLVLMLFLAACNTVGQTGPANEAEPTRVVQVEPTATAETLPSPAPKPPTIEPTEPAQTEEEIPSDPIEQPEEEETVDPAQSPEVDATRIPQPELIAAAQEVGVTLTPEAVAEFQSTQESGARGKVMYRLAGSGDTATVEVARSDADGNVTYEVIPTPGATGVSEDPENSGVLLVMASTDLAFTINTNTAGTSEVTTELTPEPEPAPEPETDPSESVELAQAAVGPEFQVTSIGTIEAETLAPKGETGEKVTYRVAYNEHGIPVARYSNENGGDYEWIAGGPFALSELNDGQPKFPGVKNGLNFLGIGVRISERLDFDGSSGNQPFVLLDANGNPTNFMCESAVVGHFLNANGEEEMGLFPIVIVNSQTGLRIRMQTFAEVPLPEWQLKDQFDAIATHYFLSNADTAGTYYDNPREVNYTFDPNAVKPRLGFGDEITFPFHYPGATPSGNNMYIDGAAFIDPLASTFYNNPNYGEFVTTGDLDNFAPTQEYAGLPVVVPATVINWQEDTLR